MKKIFKEKKRNWIKYWLPPMVWAAVIFTFSSFPTVQTTNFYLGDFLFKKSAHLVEYGILAILLYRALKNSNVRNRNSAIYAVLISFIYGVSDEFHQSFIPGRTPTLRDIFIDTLGAILAILVVTKYKKILPDKIFKLLTSLGL